jgi:hypothetical protein
VTDVPPGPGWWKASDGNWYPPQSAPGASPPPPPTAAATNKSGKGCLIAVLAVFALFAVLAILAVVAITFLGRRASDKLDEVGDALTTPSTIDASNPDARDDDHVLALGASVDISGFTATVRSAEFTEGGEGLAPGNYLAVQVSVENRDHDAQTPIGVAWQLQQPDGSVVFPVSMDGLLNASMDGGATVDGRIVFPVTGDEGNWFVLYRPDPIDQARGVWPVSR